MIRIASIILASAALAVAGDKSIKLPKMYLFNFADDEEADGAAGKKENIQKVAPIEDVKTLSLILACENEPWAVESLSNLLASPQPSNIKQIIIVDDGSNGNQITQYLSEPPFIYDHRLTLISHPRAVEEKIHDF